MFGFNTTAALQTITNRLLKKPHCLVALARLASTYWSVRFSSSNFARLASEVFLNRLQSDFSKLLVVRSPPFHNAVFTCRLFSARHGRKAAGAAKITSR